MVVKEVECYDHATRGCTIWCNHEAGYARSTATYPNPACGACRAGYYRSDDKCKECPSAGAMGFSLALFVLLAYSGFFYKISHSHGGSGGAGGGGGGGGGEKAAAQSNVYWRLVISFLAINSALGKGVKAPLPVNFKAFLELLSVFDIFLIVLSPAKSIPCIQHHFLPKSVHLNYAYQFGTIALLPYVFVLSLGFGLSMYSLACRRTHKDEAHVTAANNASAVVGDQQGGRAPARDVAKATTISYRKRVLAALIWVLWLLYPRLLDHALSVTDCVDVESVSVKGGLRDRWAGGPMKYVFAPVNNLQNT